MTRTYYLSYLVWCDGRNLEQCWSFTAKTDAEARALATDYLESSITRPSRDGLKPDTGTTSFVRMRCLVERVVKL